MAAGGGRHGETEVTGVEQSLVGKVKRPDGKWQVTLAGWPLYRYAKDQSPGDTEGQGVGGTWYAAAPTGKKAAPVKKENDNRWKGWTVVKARQDPKLGMILTDGKGRTLYRFDKDTDKPPTTTCFGSCKKAWPPVVFNGFKKLKVEGVSKKLVDFIERKDDGECQLTIDGWPMYYYEKDEQPGETKGQGVGGVWWATQPSGKRATGSGSGSGSGDGEAEVTGRAAATRPPPRHGSTGEGAEGSRVGRGPRSLRAFSIPTDNENVTSRTGRPHMPFCQVAERQGTCDQ